MASMEHTQFHLFADDGETPNNPRLPLVLYRGAVALAGARDPAAVFEKLFGANGWSEGWRNGVHGFQHFHPHAHEVLGIACGHAQVEFGGARGRVLDLVAGDVVVLPAGTGHCRRSASADLLVVGAYPDNGGSWEHARPREIDHATAQAAIARVAAPASDPVHGEHGPLIEVWRQEP